MRLKIDMRGRVILAIATLLLFSSLARAQKPVTSPRQKGNDQSLEQIDRLTEISIMPVGYSRRDGSYVLKQEFRTEEPIRVALLITNRSNETLVMDKGDRFFHYRPRLLKDGKKVVYLNGIKKQIESKDEYGPNGLALLLQ